MMCTRWYDAQMDKTSPCDVDEGFWDVDRDVKWPEDKDIYCASVSDTWHMCKSNSNGNVLAIIKTTSVTMDRHWRISLVSTPAITVNSRGKRFARVKKKRQTPLVKKKEEKREEKMTRIGWARIGVGSS